MEKSEEIFLEEKPFRGFEKQPRVLLERINMPPSNKNGKTNNCKEKYNVNLKTGTKLKLHSLKLSLKSSVTLIRQDLEELKRELNKIYVANTDNMINFKDINKNSCKTSKRLQNAAKHVAKYKRPQKRRGPKKATDNPQESKITNDTLNSDSEARLLEPINIDGNIKECNVNQNITSKDNIAEIDNSIDYITQISNEKDLTFNTVSDNSTDINSTTENLVEVRNGTKSNINPSLKKIDDQKFKRKKLSKHCCEECGKSNPCKNFLARHKPIQHIKCERVVGEETEGIDDGNESTSAFLVNPSEVKEFHDMNVKTDQIICDQSSNINNLISCIMSLQNIPYQLVVEEVPVEF
ncbi:uncharacterized protein MCAP_0864-like [Battus philenor]|uniref:uncharacterized protein MCAP_0864-like n=1 Tax=Battus philenor TaxID=42288 RepID=UPI0035D06761